MTMNAKHTPGPWHVASGVQIRGEKDQIAKVWMMRNGEGNANALLIAAAPELLEALQWYINRRERPKNPSEGWLKAEAAIAKATGENQ